MSPISARIGLTLSIGLLLLAAACSDARKSSTPFNPETGKHPANWIVDHRAAFISDESQCTPCHGSDLKGGTSGVSCFSASFGGFSCHANGPGHPTGWNIPATHGAAAKASTGFSSCQTCHGSNFAGGSIAPTCLSTAVCHGAGVNAPHASAPWVVSITSAMTHTTTNANNASVCGLCHLGNRQPPTYAALPAGTTVGCFDNTLCHGQVGHAAGWANPDTHGTAAKSAPNAAAMQGFSTCQTCHGANFGGGTATTCLNTAGCHGAAVNSPHSFPWQSTSTRKHSTTDVANASSCGLCHLANRQPPSYAALTVTVGCFDNTLCHAAAANLGCIDCHASVQAGTHGTPRDAVTAEFGLAWGHKKSGRGAVTNADCIVCHLEGEFATQARSATYHADGNIDLRDPDGAGEAPITNVSGGAFTFTKFSTSYAAGARTATGHTSNAIDNVLTQKFCLACHDSNGATNTTARTASGTAFMPWGGINLGANYTVANGAASAGGVVDVKTQLATTNSSWHPVLGPKNRDFPTAARMNDPYKPTGTRGTAGTLNLGVVINCFDCHNVSGASPLTSRTVAAHGNAETIRGIATVSGTPSAANSVTLCQVCHAGYTVAPHGTGSAWSAGNNNGMTPYAQYGCNICHSSGYTTAVPRPIRAQDTHGSNTLGTVGTLLATTSRWSTDPTPYAFIRNRQVLPQHQPKRIGVTTFTNPTCMGGNVSPCSQGSQNYSVGGTYE